MLENRIMLKQRIHVLEVENEHLKDKIAKLEENKQEQENKKHVTGAWCNGCRYHTIHTDTGCFPTRYCMLDNPCEDREEQ